MRTRFSARSARFLVRAAVQAAALLLAGTAMAGADGGLWVDQRTADDGHSADQRAILVYDSSTSTETLLLSTKYQGAPSDFAWVIPVPSLPERDQVEVCREAEWAFGALSLITAPRATEERYVGGAGCSGCIPVAGGAGGSSDAPGGVNVVDRLSVDGLDISLLDAGAGADLAAWLNGNGYRFPAEGTTVAQQYVAEGWKFVAVKVDTSQDRARQGDTWDAYFPDSPLRLTFRSDRMVFPMRISSLSTGTAGARVLLYVFADHRVKATTYPTVEAEAPVGITSTYQFSTAYESGFQGLLDQPGGRAFVVEYAHKGYYEASLLAAGILKPDTRYYLTRLRSHLRAQDMGADVVLANADTDAGFEIDVALPGSAQASGMLLPLAAVAACFVICRRRGLSPRYAAKESLFLGLLLLGACFSA